MKGQKAYGRADAPVLFVMVSKPSEGMEAWFWRQLHKAGILKTQCRIVYLIDDPPAGSGNKPLKAQIKSARERFEQEIRRSSPQVVVPMATETFYFLTGINESVFDARGYLIRKDLFHHRPYDVWKQVGEYKNASKATGAKRGDPKMKWVTEAGAPLLGDDFDGVVIPTFGLDHIRTESFAVSPAFIEDVKRVKRALDGDLREVERGLRITTEVDELPAPGKLGRIIAVDIETHGVDNEVIDLVSFSDGKTTGVLEWSEPARLYMQRVFALPNRLFAVHNSPFDIPRLRANGVFIDDEVVDHQVFDTMFAAVNVQPALHKALGRVASLYLDIPPWKTASRRKDSHWRAMVLADPKRYSGKDSFFTHWLAVVLEAVMKQLGSWKYFMGVEGHPGPGVMATIPELTAMSRGGLRTNRAYAEQWMPRLERKMLRYLKLWHRMFPSVKFSSNPQVRKLLYKTWGLPVQRSKEDGVSVDELALITLQAYTRDQREDTMIPGAWQSDARAVPRTFDLMLKMRETEKMLNTYVQPIVLKEENWVHPSYLPASKDDERGGQRMDNKGATDTGRLVAYKPNIQNQPKESRVLYVPDTDEMCFVQADYKSAELFVLAGMANDEKLLADLLSGDMHGRNAERFGISRDVVKNVTYASMYLASPTKQSSMILEQEHKYVSPGECLGTSTSIWSYYTDTNAYREFLVTLCDSKRYITNPFGRTRFFHSGRATAAVNFIPQSTVADILWCVLKDVAKMLRSLGGRLVTTVHDSILACVPYAVREEAARRMREIMERRFDCVRKGFYIPVDIEMGEPGASWAHLKKWKEAA